MTQSQVLSNICAQSARELVLKVPSHPLMWTHVNEHLDVVHAGQVVRPDTRTGGCSYAKTQQPPPIHRRTQWMTIKLLEAPRALSLLERVSPKYFFSSTPERLFT